MSNGKYFFGVVLLSAYFPEFAIFFIEILNNLASFGISESDKNNIFII